MSFASSERERIRINIERIDHRLAEVQDCQEAVHAVARQQYLEQLSLSSQVVVSQEMLNCQLADVNTGLGDLGTVVTDLSQGIDALGSMFQWGFDEIICQLELVRDDLREILKTLRRPLETQAKELCRRGFLALSNGWYDEALEDLSASAEYDYPDFAVHRALGTIHLRKDHWKDARSAFAKAAKYAGPYSPHIAAECELETSLACRQMSDCEEAYEHTRAAVELRNDSLMAHYEHAVNAVCVYKSAATQVQRTSELQDEALSELRYVLWKDSRYAMRVERETYFEPIRSQCAHLVQELQIHLQREADRSLEEVERSIRMIHTDRSLQQLATLAPKAFEGYRELQALRSRGSICDLQELDRTLPSVRAQISLSSDFVHRVKTRMLNGVRVYTKVRDAVISDAWPQHQIEEIEELYRSSNLADYQELDTKVAILEQNVYRILEQGLISARDATTKELERVRRLATSERQRLQSETKILEEKMKADRASTVLGWLFWLVQIAVLVAIFHYLPLQPITGFFMVLVFIMGGTIVTSVVLFLVLTKVISTIQKARCERARACVDAYRPPPDIEALDSRVKILNAMIERCQRKEVVDLPEGIRNILRG